MSSLNIQLGMQDKVVLFGYSPTPSAGIILPHYGRRWLGRSLSLPGFQRWGDCVQAGFNSRWFVGCDVQIMALQQTLEGTEVAVITLQITFKMIRLYFVLPKTSGMYRVPPSQGYPRGGWYTSTATTTTLKLRRPTPAGSISSFSRKCVSLIGLKWKSSARYMAAPPLLWSYLE